MYLLSERDQQLSKEQLWTDRQTDTSRGLIWKKYAIYENRLRL